MTLLTADHAITEVEIDLIDVASDEELTDDTLLEELEAWGMNIRPCANGCDALLVTDDEPHGCLFDEESSSDDMTYC